MYQSEIQLVKQT